MKIAGYSELKNILFQYRQIYFYGAGVVAFGAYKAIHELFHVTVSGFLISEEEKTSQIEKIPVIPIRRAKIDREKSIIIITAPEIYHYDMEKTLKLLQYHNYVKFDSKIEYTLMGTYLRLVKKLHLIEECRVKDISIGSDVCRIYMAVSHRDQKLKETYIEKPWVEKIQVGAALSKKRIAALTDEGRDSLSEQNALYGELTATYYIWKHNCHAITGLFHYRRVLEVTKEQLGLLWEQKVDIILPLPFVCTPDASGQYGRYILSEDIEIMLEVLKEKEPQYFSETMTILKAQYLYNYNILIARKEIFDDYCSWLFPLLEEITHRCEKIERKRMTRYIGRIGEVLSSIYFMRNEKHLHIAHAEKVWRV